MAGGKRNKLKPAVAPVSVPPSNDLDDDELVDDLLAQLDARDTTVQQQSAKILSETEAHQHQNIQNVRSKNGSKNRHKARAMRNAAARARVAPQTLEEEAASERLREEAEEEQKTIRGICDVQGLEIYEINPDGHCLFAAVADQLALLSVLPLQRATYNTTRHAAADYIETHPDDFLPFLLSMDGTAGSSGGLMSLEDFRKYCATIRDTGAWGGEPEILAMARVFNVPIHVIQWGTPSVVIHSPNPGGKSSDGVVRVSYHRRMYGLGEHYNSLRPRNNHLDKDLAVSV